MEFGPYKIEILGLGSSFSLADALRELAAEPRFNTVGILICQFHECLRPFLPDVACFSSDVGIRNVCQKIAFQHIRGSKRETTVIHCLENRIGIFIRISRNFIKMNILDQPIGEIRKRRTCEFFRKALSMSW